MGGTINVPTNSLTSKNTQSCGCLQAESTKKYGKAHRKLNRYNLDGEYGIGYTSKDEEFYFDKEDYDKVKEYTWHINPEGYVQSMHNATITKFYIDTFEEAVKAREEAEEKYHKEFCYDNEVKK